MRFHTKLHKFYCWIDLHPRTMFGGVRIDRGGLICASHLFALPADSTSLRTLTDDALRLALPRNQRPPASTSSNSAITRSWPSSPVSTMDSKSGFTGFRVIVVCRHESPSRTFLLS